MKTLKENKKWSTGVTEYLLENGNDNRPKIGDDDGISDKAMNMVIVLFMLLTVGVTLAVANPANHAAGNGPALLQKAMNDIDQMRYESAINKLLNVRSVSPDNANLDYLLGKCYLYGDVSAEKAVYYLNKALSCISQDYEAWSVSEECAPIETMYLLAQAYEETQHFDMAFDYYQQFLGLLNTNNLSSKSRTYGIVARAAQHCKEAADMQERIAFNKN